MPNYEPGNWPVLYPAGEPEIFADSGIDQSLFEQMAIDMLWNWTNRFLSTYTVSVRPCRAQKPDIDPPSSFEGSGPWPINPGFGSGHSTIGGYGVGWWQPALIGGVWYNLYCGRCASEQCQCGPGQLVSISLPGPVVGIDEVLIDGAIVPASAYWVSNKRMLNRVDGGDWPFLQDLSVEPDQPNTWQVTYQKGIEVPVGGQIAAGVLAVELAKSSIDDRSCRLPKRVSTITREGVSMTVLDPFSQSKGMSRSSMEVPKPVAVGIWEIDSWIAGIMVPRSTASVRSPDHAGTTRWKY